MLARECAQILARKPACHFKFPAPILARRSIELMVAPTSFARNKEIFGEGEPAEYVYKVESGCIRAYNIYDDGRRHIGAFYLPGDYMALEASKEYDYSADAVTPSLVRAINRKKLMARAAKSPTLLKYLLNVTALELRRTQNHNRLLLRSAQERVVTFLLGTAIRNQLLSSIDLPMMRQDIADHLGLAIETVSRVLSRLECASAISMRSRHCIVINNLSAFNQLGT